MRAQSLEALPAAAPPLRSAARPAAGILAQRHSTLGGGSVSASPILDSGRPLEPATRSEMERGFGQDFGAIRVHDDARAHDNARSLGAIAYAAGNDIVFGQGQYAPETPAGRALIAHELAHSVQQGGVQMKADGSLPVAADARLEAEADRAAQAVTAGRTAPSLTRIGAPAVFRSEGSPPVGTPPPGPGNEAAPVADTKAVAPGPVPGLPSDVEVIEENPKGTGSTYLVVSLPMLTLPRVKGPGDWVKQAYATMAGGQRLIFSPIFDGANYEAATSIKAFMEKPGEKYKDIWLQSHGFTTLQGMAKAFRDAALTNDEVKGALAKAEVKKIIDGFAAGKLTSAGCDIDHIVEKQIGGTSVPGNLQLLVSDKNQESGRQTYATMIAEVKRILEPNRTKVTQLQIRFKSATVPDDTSDGSFEVETLLRKGAVKGSADVKKKGEGAPVALVAGAAPEIVNVKATGTTPIEASERRLIPGMKLLNYVRGPGSSATTGTDKVEAELASKPMLPGDKVISLTATATAAAAPASPAAPGPATPGADPAAATAGEPAASAASETRKLTLDPTKNKDIPFYYPYLSKGKLTKMAVDAEGKVSGEGTISPSVKFLGDIKIKFGPDMLAVEAPLDASKFKSPIPMITFTSGSLALQLAPSLKPEGNLKFAIGPAAKPLMLGEIKATEEGGAFVATGTLTPGMSLPGISDASGTVRYHSQNGWSGSLKAKSAGKLPNSTIDAEFAFKEEGGKFVLSATGGMVTQVRDKTLTLKVSWNEQTGIVYSGGFTWDKPFPIVDSVAVKGSYGGNQLSLSGNTTFNFRQWVGHIEVNYQQKDGQPGKLWGTGSVAVETKNKKGKGKLAVKVDEAGELTGSGEIAYQLTDKIKPLLGVTLGAGGHLRINAAVEIGTVDLFSKWPEGDKGKRTLMSASPSFKIPTPVPGLNAAVNIHASVGISFSIGPGQIRKVVLAGSFDPLEENPNVTATLKGDFVIPTKFSLYGEFGAELAAEIAGGLAGIAGGLEVVPSVSLGADAIAAFEAKYDKGEFAFDGKAYLDAQLKARLGINLTATIYGLYHALEYRWRYPVAAVEKQLGPNIVINLGKVSYSTAKGMTWPSLSDISIEPKNLDPLAMVKQLLNEKSEKETK